MMVVIVQVDRCRKVFDWVFSGGLHRNPCNSLPCGENHRWRFGNRACCSGGVSSNSIRI